MPWLWCQLRRPDQPCPRDRPKGEAWRDGPTDTSSNSSLETWISRSPPSHSALPCWCAQPESPWCEQFDSAREDVEEDGEATSALDAELDASTGKETDASGHAAQSPSAKRCRRRNRAMRRERTRARREFRRPKNRRLSFPLFRETTKEDAIFYRDWRSEIEDALEHGHDAAKVKEAMFASLEGMARDNAKMIDENGDLHVTRILDGLGLLVWGVHDLSVAQCCLVRSATEADGVRSRLLQSYGANNHHLERTPR